ncbi:hypothetical protein IKB17_05420 [bacterium]|nr:hypothetical protein [bacterium]
MKISNYRNPTTFQGKLDTSRLGKGKVYWESIAEKVEAESLKYPDAKLCLSENFLQYINTKTNKEGCHTFLKKGALNKLLNNTPFYQIVNTLVNYIKISDTVFNTLEEAERFANICENLNSKINDNSEKNPFKTVYSPALNLVSRYIKSEANKDDILKQWKIHP